MNNSRKRIVIVENESFVSQSKPFEKTTPTKVATSIKTSLTFLLLCFSSPLIADEANKFDVYNDLAEKLFDAYEDDFDLDDEENKVVLSNVIDNSNHHSKEEVDIVVGLLEEKISRESMLYPKDNQRKNINFNIELTFSDTINPVDSNEVEYTWTVKMAVTEPSSGIKKHQKILTTAYEREAYHESYVIRDSLTTIFTTTAVISGIGLVYAFGNSTVLGTKAKREESEAKKSDLEDESKTYEKAAIGLAGAAIITGVLAYISHPDKDTKTYYSYDLVSIPTNSSDFKNIFAINFKYDF